MKFEKTEKTYGKVRVTTRLQGAPKREATARGLLLLSQGETIPTQCLFKPETDRRWLFRFFFSRFLFILFVSDTSSASSKASGKYGFDFFRAKSGSWAEEEQIDGVYYE
ncbi:hypothetical protein F2P56_022255 [Juglans regia]|uniref:Uncharacterized protein n=1 Tax=Juglans regia TaxID=51240 RepID=A0A833USQ1_JUGRE|nr:hypothetical protein F2P56_022255 [Juglans regia]